jgi:hypothetical protein
MARDFALNASRTLKARSAPPRLPHPEGLSGLGAAFRAGELRGRTLSALESSPERRPADGRRALHDHESGTLQMLDLPLRDDLGDDRVGGTDSLAAGIAQRERERSGDIVGIGGHELVVGHSRA